MVPLCRALLRAGRCSGADTRGAALIHRRSRRSHDNGAAVGSATTSLYRGRGRGTEKLGEAVPLRSRTLQLPGRRVNNAKGLFKKLQNILIHSFANELEEETQSTT